MDTSGDSSLRQTPSNNRRVSAPRIDCESLSCHHLHPKFLAKKIAGGLSSDHHSAALASPAPAERFCSRRRLSVSSVTAREGNSHRLSAHRRGCGAEGSGAPLVTSTVTMNRAAFAAAVAAARGTGRVAARVTTRTAAVPRANVGGQGATRRMGTSTHQAGSGGGRRPYGGFEPHMPTDVYVKSSLYLQALMWFWVFYRFKEDGAVLLVSCVAAMPRSCFGVLDATP